MSGKLTIKFTNGDEQAYEFEPQTQPKMIGSKLKEILSSSALIIQLEKDLEIIPFANIQSITVLQPDGDASEIKIQGALIAKRIS